MYIGSYFSQALINNSDDAFVSGFEVSTETIKITLTDLTHRNNEKVADIFKLNENMTTTEKVNTSDLMMMMIR